MSNFDKNFLPLIMSAFVMLIMCISFDLKADNEITIKNQEGNSFNLNITQVGSDNVIDCYQTASCYNEGNNLSLHFEQSNYSGVENKIQIWHLEGHNNEIRWGQGLALSSSTDTTFSYDGTEGGGHYARHDIHGHNNSVAGSQTNQGSTSGHNYTSLIFADYNAVFVKQRGDGSKTFNLVIYNDNNDVSVSQQGYNAQHNANVTLSGTDPTSLNLVQNSSTAQTYTLQQSCYTVGGCSVSVTQQ